jgi:hypothetical protein
MVQLYPRALSSLSITSYDSQGYSGGIITRLHMGIGSSLVNNLKVDQI